MPRTRLPVSGHAVVLALLAMLGGVIPAASAGEWCAVSSCPGCAAHGFRSSGRECYASQSACRDAIATARAGTGSGVSYSGCDHEEGATTPAAPAAANALAGQLLANIEAAREASRQEQARSAQAYSRAEQSNTLQRQAIAGEEQQQLQNADARVQELARRRRALIGQLVDGTRSGSELAPGRSGADAVPTPGGTNFFGIPTQPKDTLLVGEAGQGLAIVAPAEPATPPSSPLRPSAAQVAVARYQQATDDLARDEARYRALEEAKRAADREREAAERRVRELKAQVPAPAVPAAPAVDDQLAAAEKLLSEATELDEQASLDLNKAERDVKQAKLEVDRRDPARAQAQSGAASPAPP